MDKTVKTDNFLRAIKKYADRQRKHMREEVEQLKEIKLSEAEKKAKLDSKKLISDKLEAKRNEETSRLAKLTQDGQRKLFEKRAEMTEKIFETAAQRLVKYSESSEYKEMLLKNAKEVASVFKDQDCVVYVNEKDISMQAEIKAVFAGKAEIEADKGIKIGGLKGYCKAMSIVADETLDSKLEAQREWFIENSGLSVL